MCRGSSAQGDPGVFMRCGGCGVAKYCTKACQKTDSPSHKQICRSSSAEQAHMGLKPGSWKNKLDAQGHSALHVKP